nr:MAG TPA: hypothetical protein [Bacteriophage sp.]
MKKKYIKKQGEPFDAIQWNGHNVNEVKKFVSEYRVMYYDNKFIILYDALHLPIVAQIGDYILCRNGNASVINQHFFEEEYKEL